MSYYVGVDSAADKHDVCARATRRATSCWRPRSRTMSGGAGAVPHAAAAEG